MSTWVKICGLSSREAVQAAAEAGADAVGFVFAESPRRVLPGEARRLCEGLDRRVVRVAVMRHPGPDEWAAVRDGFAPDWLQTDAADFATLELPDACARLPVYRDDNAGLTSRSTEIPARFLFEGARSGTGQRADWSAAAALAPRAELVLAGGLSPDNVEEALAAVAPWGVDVSSGVERAPGYKDPARIAAFVERVRRWDRRATESRSRTQDE
ncbi:phosphoribosylanthranilate isomerase [Lentisalinibacter sediminis]|uniref:phosphoribosylanthranilate isomerase n=1 Tax=Lentisalinibacter sediminis TaxID=2992237 RepID=UPI00386D65F6